jgi:hypothetical protein
MRLATAARGVQRAQAEENEARRFQCRRGAAGDEIATVGQRRGLDAGALQIGARLLDLRRAHPRVTLGGPAIHDRVGRRFESPRGFRAGVTGRGVECHAVASYSPPRVRDTRRKRCVVVKKSARRVAGAAWFCALMLGCSLAPPAAAWGPLGHALVVRAALQKADALPPWFAGAGDELADLANAPDRWRGDERAVPALAARSADHYFDLDVWGRESLPRTRWVYVRRATQRGLAPEDIGFLPFAMLEEYGVLLGAFRDARASRPGAREGALAAAGVLAHLAGDAAVPLHLTRHHHGWKGRNPEGFTQDPGVHRWFESGLVEGAKAEGIAREVEAVRLPADAADAVRAVLEESLALVPRLYRLEKSCRRGDDEECRTMARARLAAGAALLVKLWESAWERSGA